MSEQKNRKDEEDESFEDGDQDQPIPPIDIVAFNEQRSCADLYRMKISGKLELQPEFQREEVWRPEDKTRFIDSLVKQLPIPSMCFSLDYKTQKWKVIDGLQRMTSIVKFLSDADWRLSSLTDIHPKLSGRRNTDLKNGDEESRRLYSRVEDLTIPTTVIRCDYTQKSHMNYLFTIFHRLNSGGVRLNNQEIRNCIYSGVFNTALKEFDSKNLDWQKVKNRIWGKMHRFKSVEVLLRILAFGDGRDKYEGNLAGFLNAHMHECMDDNFRSEKSIQVLEMVASKSRMILESEPNKKMPLMVIEALLVALYVQSESIQSRSNDELVSSYRNLLNLEVFSERARYDVSSQTNVKERLNAAVSAFA